MNTPTTYSQPLLLLINEGISQEHYCSNIHGKKRHSTTDGECKGRNSPLIWSIFVIYEAIRKDGHLAIDDECKG
jgi:hypothetical protein